MAGNDDLNFIKDWQMDIENPNLMSVIWAAGRLRSVYLANTSHVVEEYKIRKELWDQAMNALGLLYIQSIEDQTMSEYMRAMQELGGN